MVEHLGAGFDHDPDRFLVALEVGDEHLDAAAGGLAANFLDDHGEDARSAHQIVVAIHAGDDGMFQAQCGNRFGHAARFVKVDRLGTALGHGAETAAPRAQVAEHHEGGGFVVPALADVGAVRAFAYRVQPQGARQPLEIVVVFAHRSARLEPLRLGRRNPPRRLDLHQFHHALIVAAPSVDGIPREIVRLRDAFRMLLPGSKPFRLWTHLFPVRPLCGSDGLEPAGERSCSQGIELKGVKYETRPPFDRFVIFLATGLSLIFGYCNGASSLNAAYPLASSALHLDITTIGPAALGGLRPCRHGAVTAIWALLAAIVAQIGLLAGNHKTARQDCAFGENS